jgi:hypothetical protein
MKIKQGAGCRVRTDKYRCEGIADERAWAVAPAQHARDMTRNY